MYSELRLCVDALGVVCVVWGLSLFAGTKRETLRDRDNIVGLLRQELRYRHMAASTRSCDGAVTLRSQATYSDGAVRQERWLLPQDGFGCTTSVIHQRKTWRTLLQVVLSIYPRIVTYQTQLGTPIRSGYFGRRTALATFRL